MASWESDRCPLSCQEWEVFSDSIPWWFHLLQRFVFFLGGESSQGPFHKQPLGVVWCRSTKVWIERAWCKTCYVMQSRCVFSCISKSDKLTFWCTNVRFSDNKKPCPPPKKKLMTQINHAFTVKDLIQK